MTRLGEDPPEDDELDEVWPVGDLDLFTDLGLPRGRDGTDPRRPRRLPDEMLDTIVERIGIADQYAEATDAARAAR